MAWNLLEKRYENTQILVRFHIEALFDLNNVKEECHQSLRSLLDGLNKHIRALEVLKQPGAFWDALLIHMISLKLDSATRREWESEYSKHDLVSLEGFTTFLNDKCKLLETIQINNPQKAKRHFQVCKSIIELQSVLYVTKTILYIIVKLFLTLIQLKDWQKLKNENGVLIALE